MRVVLTAVALSALSFMVGVVADLAAAPPAPVSGVAVTLRIPPELPVDSVRARPLPPLATASASATPRRRSAVLAVDNSPAPFAEPVAAETKPRAERLLLGVRDKLDPEDQAKAKSRKAA